MDNAAQEFLVRDDLRSAASQLYFEMEGLNLSFSMVQSLKCQAFKGEPVFAVHHDLVHNSFFLQ